MMTPRKPKPVAVNDAKDFDFEAFLLGFKRPEFIRNLYQRADLIPRLSELDEITTDLEARLAKLDAAGGDDAERSITDINPAVQLRERLTVLTEEFNTLAGEYESSAVPFTFRVPDGKGDLKAQIDAMTADGVLQDKEPEDPQEATDYIELSATYSMALTCTSHVMTVPQWQAFREKVGEPAWMTLVNAWLEAAKASRPAAPFSLKHVPGPITPVSSVV